MAPDTDNDTPRPTTQAVTVHLPPGLYEELQAEARRQERPVGELVREAVMIRYGAAGESRRVEAVEKLAQLNGEVPDDPEQLEAEIIRGAMEQSGRS